MAKDILIVPGSSNIQFSGSAVNDIRIETLDSGSVAFTSTSGSLLTITNSLTGSLFSVGDLSGVPIFDVNSDDTVTLGQFSSPIKVLTNASGHTTISGSSTSTGSFGKILGDVTIPSGKALRTSLIRGGSPVAIDTGGTNVNITGSLIISGSDLTFNKPVFGGNTLENFFRIKLQNFGGTTNDVGIGQGASGNMGFNVSAGGYYDFYEGTNGLKMRFINGRLGIGETNPGYPLEIVGATGNTVAKFGETMALHMIHNAPVLGFNLYYNSGYKFGEGSSSSYGGYLALSPGDGKFTFATSNAGNANGTATMTERVTILNDGKVGIGTNNPNRPLTIVGSAASINLDSPDNTFIHIDRGAADDVAEIAFRTGGANKYFVGLGDSGNFSDGSEFFIGAGSGGSGNRRITLDSTGETTFISNNATVEIATTTNGTYGVRSTSPAKFNDYYFNGTTGAIRNTSGTSYMSFDSSGNATIPQNLTVAGSITAQEFITELNTVTIIESSGSTKFGNTNDDLHQFTGSMRIQRGDDVSLKLMRGSQLVSYLGDTGSQNDGGLILYDESGNQDVLIRTKDARDSFINTTGNFGFGTSVPGNKVHIQQNNSDDYSATGDDYANAILRLHNSNTTATTPHALIHFRLDKNGGDGYLGFITDGSTGNVEHFVLGNQTDNEILRIKSGGNVGIGSTNPQHPLDVVGNARVGNNLYMSNRGILSWDSATAEFRVTATSGNKLKLGAGGSSSHITVTTAGYVGINKTGPGYHLDVGGQIFTNTAPLIINPSSGNAYIHIESENAWAFTRLAYNGSTAWDIASYQGGDLQFRPAGAASGAVLFNSAGNITTPGVIKTTYAGKAIHVDSSGGAYISIDTNGNTWNYLNYVVDGSTAWDVGTLNGGNYEIRPGGGDSNRLTYSSSGVLSIPSVVTTGTITVGSEVLNTNFSSSIAGRVSTLQAASSGITISNNANNRVLTGDGTNANAEANLIFNGSKLGVGGSAFLNKTLEVLLNNAETDVTAEGLLGGTAGAGVLIHNTNSTNNSYANLDFRAYDGDARIAVQRTATNTCQMHFVVDNAGTAKNAMTIRNDGNIGIGTTSPQTSLHVNGNISGSTLYLNGAVSAQNGNSQFGKTDGTGNTTATFVVAATNTAGSPGIATKIRLVGYESRGIGIVTSDTNSNHKFFAGVPYAGSNVNYTIGYHPSTEEYAGYLSTHGSVGGHGSIVVVDGPNKRVGIGAGFGGQGMSTTLDVSGSFRVITPTVTDALRVFPSTGKVGIGTSAPGVATLNLFNATPFLYVGDGTPNNDNTWDTNIQMDSNAHSRLRIEQRNDNKNLELYVHGGIEPTIRATDSATKLRLGVGGSIKLELASASTTVQGTLITTGEVQINSNDGIDVNAGAATLNASHSGGTSALYSGYGFSTATSVTNITNASKISFQTGNTERVEIKSGGDTNFKGWIEGNGQNALYSSTGDGLLLQAPSTTEKIFFRDLNGNVGMTYDAANKRLGLGAGAGSPVANLHIEGDEPELFIKHTGTAGNDKTTITWGDKHGQAHAKLFTQLKDDTNGSAYDSEFHIQTAVDGTLADRIVIEEQGHVTIPTNNVGIGGTTPGAKLEVYSDGTALNQIRLRHNGSGTNGTLDLSATSTNANIVANYSSTAIPLRFFTGATERMVITQAGNVGIGDTSPSYLLDVGGVAQMGTMRLANGFTLTQGTSNYANLGSWINVGTIGLYSGTNGAHIYPNQGSTFGAWRINGSRNGYGGFSITTDSSHYNVLMSNSSNMGFYNDNDNEWMIQAVVNGQVNLFYNGVSKLSTSSAGISVAGSVTATGTYAASGDFDIYSANNKLVTISNANSSIGLLRSTNVSGDLTVTGTLTAQEFRTEFLNNIIIETSGSTKFGNSADDVHQFTGSLKLQGSADFGSGGEIKVSKVTGTSPLSISAGGDRVSVTGSLVTNSSATIAGNLGLGATPSQHLDIVKSGARMRLTDSSNQLNIGLWDGSNYRIEGDANRPIFITSYNSTGIKLGISGGTHLAIDGSGNINIASGKNLSVGSTWAPAGTYGVARFHGDHNGGGTRVMFSNANSSTRYGIVMHGSDTGTADKFGIGLLMAANGTYTNAVPAITIDSSKRVGIGTTIPDATLTVQGASNAVKFKSSNGEPRFNFFTGGDTDAGSMDVYDATGNVDMRLNTGGTSWLGMNGNVGIGTASPGFKFHVDYGAVSSADRNIAVFQAEDTRRIGFVWDDSISSLGIATLTSHKLTFNTAGINPRMTIDTSGNVGIGTTNPDSILHVISPEIGNGSDRGIKISNYNETKEYSIRTGISGNANTQLDIYDNTAGASRITLLTGGNVGIGTSSPKGDFVVQTTAGSVDIPNMANGQLAVAAGSSTIYAGIFGKQTSNQIGLQMMAATPDTNTSTYGDMNFNIRENDDSEFATVSGKPGFVFSRYGTHLMAINRDGKVGIGMTPTEFVDIEKSDNTHRTLQFTNTHNGTGASGGFKATSNAGTLFMRAISSGFSTSGRNIASTSQLLSTSTGGLVIASSHATAEMTFWTNNTQRVTIDGATGNVGIGNTGPSYKLHVNGTAFAKNLTLSGWSTGDGLTLNYGNSTGTVEAVTFRANGGVNGNIKMVMAAANNGDMHFNASNRTNQLVMYRDGKVGIGTNVPSQLLDVYGSIQVYSDIRMYNGTSIRFHGNGVVGSDGNTQTFGSTAGAVNTRFSVGGISSAMVISGSTGNVGVGTTVPTQLLHVHAGDILMTGGPSHGNPIAAVRWTYSTESSFGTSGKIDVIRNDADQGKGGDMRFFTQADNTSDGGTERFRIDQAGQLIIRQNNKFLHGLTTGNATIKLIGMRSDNWVQIADANYGVRTGNGLWSLDGADNMTVNAGAYFKEYLYHFQDTDTHIRFQTDHIDLTTAGTLGLRVNDSGNVGIGQSNPTAKLHIYGGDYNTGLILQASSNAIGITFMGSDGVVDGYVYGNSGAIGFLDDDSHWAIQHQTDSHTSFYINNSEKMRLDSSGRLGIGVTGHSAQLEVKRAGSNLARFYNSNGDTAGTQIWIGATKPLESSHQLIGGITSRFTSTAWVSATVEFKGPQSTGYGDGINYLTFNHDGSNQRSVFTGRVGINHANPADPLHIYGGSGSTINFDTNGTSNWRVGATTTTGGYSTGNAFAWYCFDNTSYKMTLTTAGRLGIGVLSPSHTLHIDGDQRIHNGSLGIDVTPSTTDGVLRAGNDVIAYYSSDERLKENVKQIENPIEKVKQLRGVEFDWIVDEEIHPNKGHDIGVIAQDVEKVLPEIVETRKSGYKAVKYEKMVSLLIESVKEQQKQIEELKSEIQELKDGSSK